MSVSICSFARMPLTPCTPTPSWVSTDERSTGDIRVALINDDPYPDVFAANGGFELSDIDFAIFTQVRKPSIELVMAELGLPMERTHTVMEKWGYTGSACVPIALDDAIEQGKLASGDLLVMVGSGVGYNQAGAAFRMR